MNQHMGHHNGHDGFMSMENMKKNLLGTMMGEKRDYERKVALDRNLSINWDLALQRLSKWFEDDDPKVARHEDHIGGLVNCNELADEWWRWIITTPANASPVYGMIPAGPQTPHLYKKEVGGKTAKVYMVGVSAFKKEPADVKRLVVNERNHILIPAYNMAAGAEEYLYDDKKTGGGIGSNMGQIGKKLTDLILKDLCGIRDFEATLDGEPVEGCTVIREKPYIIENIPNDNIMKIPQERFMSNNSMRTCHAGFYLLLNPLESGDHLLYFRARSIYYEVEAQVNISVLTR